MITRNPRVAVCGSNVAAMVSAISLAGRGADVLLVTPASRLGGHFAGLMVGGHLFDAGMTLLELTSFNNDPGAPLGSYDPAIRNDIGRFATRVAETLRSFGGWRDVSTPAMWWEGSLLPDLLLGNQLAGLRALPHHVREKMRAELAIRAQERGPLHASRKVSRPEFARLDLETVSLANHGPTFHDLFIESFCRKVTSLPTSHLAALYHRLAWLPLYWPETLLDELDGRLTHLPATVFSYPTSGSVAALVRTIESAARSLPGVTVLQGQVTGLRHASGYAPFTVEIGGREQVTVDHLVWAAESNQLLESAGEQRLETETKGSLALVSALVRPEQLGSPSSTMFIPGSPDLPFRVTNQTWAAGLDEPAARISCEWNPSLINAPEVDARVRSALVELDVITSPDAVLEMRVDMLKEVLPLGTLENVRRSTARGTRCREALPGVIMVGPSAPFGAGSLNDQVIQGLKIGEDPSIC